MEKISFHKILNFIRWFFAGLAILSMVYYFYSNETLASPLFISELFWFLAMGLTAVILFARMPRKNKGRKAETLELILLVAFIAIAFAFGVMYLLLQ